MLLTCILVNAVILFLGASKVGRGTDQRRAQLSADFQRDENEDVQVTKRLVENNE